MSAIENVDGLDAGMADGMELLPPPETADEKTADEKLHGCVRAERGVSGVVPG